MATDSCTLSLAKRKITQRPGLSHQELARDLKLKNDRHFKSRIAPRLRDDGFTYTRQTGWQPERPDIIAGFDGLQIVRTAAEKRAIRTLQELIRDGKVREVFKR